MKYYASFVEKTDQYTMEGVLDYFNERIRIDHYTGNVEAVIEKLEELAEMHAFTKYIVKGRGEHLSRLFSLGYTLEAVISGYFQGHDAYMVTKYKSDARRNSEYWVREDDIVQAITKSSLRNDKDIPSHFVLRKATEQDALSLAQLFGQVFQVYPTPLNKEDYIIKTMNEDTVYYVYETNGTIVSTASAEIDSIQKNAELTNCATLPEYRKHGLMKKLLKRLEEELQSRAIFCSYTIARSLSYGMNAAFYQLGYTYTGRMTNNCYIYDKLEDMNVWVKDLSK
ncbi:putative beta-lysine N-acetyltransferase [Microbacteriaceae bacterium 4G12]